MGRDSELKYLSWDLPWELRCNTVAAESPEHNFESREPEELFAHVVRSTNEDYESARDPDYPDALVVRNGGLWFDSPGAEWCALSPVLARACGWHRGAGLFEWVDRHEQSMVRSLWWVDGLIEHGAAHWTEVGEGWLVVATNEAVESIQSVVGDLVHLVAVQRRFLGAERPRDAGRRRRHHKAFLKIPWGGGASKT
jgi:hypothetical protein